MNDQGQLLYEFGNVTIKLNDINGLSLLKHIQQYQYENVNVTLTFNDINGMSVIKTIQQYQYETLNVPLLWNDNNAKIIDSYKNYENIIYNDLTTQTK